MRLSILVLAGLLLASPAKAGSLADWAVVVASGDDHAGHSDVKTETFDNARRDVAARLIRRGASAINLDQFSVGDPHRAATPGRVLGRLRDLSRAAPGGCLLYLTSHGGPGEIVMADAVVSPVWLARRLTSACGAKPTAIILSACFSGSFIPALKGPNRFILTAARRDRSSFGCGESDRYPYFDGCVIEALPTVHDLAELARRATDCVTRREDEEGLRPRSEPQLWIGPAFQGAAPTFTP